MFRYVGEVYRDQSEDGRQWRWRVRARNGKVVADSAEGYRNQGHAKKMCRRVCRVFRVKVLYS